MKEQNNYFSTKKLTVAALLLALGIILPQIFHIGGPATGGIFLPMHLSIFIGGLLLGPYYGMGVGIITPLISFLLTGMPPAAKLPFMIMELLSYGFISGFLSKKKVNLYISLITAQISGRVIYGIMLYVGANLLHLKVPAAATVGTALVTGIPGIIIQLIFVPALVVILRKVVQFEREYAAN